MQLTSALGDQLRENETVSAIYQQTLEVSNSRS